MKSLLASEKKCDVLSAIDFFSLGIDIRFVRCLISLISTKEKDIRKAVSKALHTIVFSTGLYNDLHHSKVGENLFELCDMMSVHEFDLMHFTLKMWIESSEMNEEVIRSIFEIVTNREIELTSCGWNFMISASL